MTCPRDGAGLVLAKAAGAEGFRQRPTVRTRNLPHLDASSSSFGEDSTTNRRGRDFFGRSDLAFGDMSTRILDDSVDEELSQSVVESAETERLDSAGLARVQAELRDVRVQAEPRDVRVTTLGKSNGVRAPSSAGVSPEGEVPQGTRVSVIENMPEKVASGDEAADRLGETLGSYRLLSIIGRGGMGCVYEAVHTKLGRKVALKVLNTEYARRKDAVARFIQEAQAVNQIRHRNIVDITDLVETEDGNIFIIMELLEGQSLTALLREGRLGRERAVALLVQICDALAAAHGQGIIHRDLKPDNMVIVSSEDGDDQVKLLDFGVAKLLNPGHVEGLTAAGAVVGTPAFMSPEQAAGLNVDVRSDLYSLGAIMYELFCEQPMFRGASFGEYVRKHLEEMPISPSQTIGADQIDSQLESIIMRCLEKSPDARFQNADDLKAELLALLSDEDVSRVSMLTGVMKSQDFDTQAMTLHNHGGLVDDEATVISPHAPAPYPDWQQPPAATPGMQTAMVFGDVPTEQDSGKRNRLVWGGVAAMVVAIAVISVVATAATGDGDDGDDGKDEVAASEAIIGGPEATSLDEDAEDGTKQATEVESDKREVEIRSTPAGSLYADGVEEPLCATTPCKINVSVTSEPGAFAVYIVKRQGYEDDQFKV
ncbi:MAG: serine/threonine protein kinase, partial [Deltaproteobacteria bacterium]|nr:serine/threonine protein kinase [Deltaproteobacteria bacterium]